MFKKFFLMFCTALIFFNFSFAEEDNTEQTIRYIEPKLASDVKEYDPMHPEELNINQLYAKSAILIEADTGKVLFEKNADDTMYPASTTKIFTVLLGLINGDLNAQVTMSETAAEIDPGSSKIPLEIGETINFKDLLYATMLRSGNEGANLIAEAVSGSIPAFVDGMNTSAKNLGLTNTHFANPHGLHNQNHYTTARDMAKIAQEAIKNEEFRKIVAASSYTLPKSNMNPKRKLASRISEFITQNSESDFSYYPYAKGIKTGFTNAAGHCFVGYAENLGVNLISVVFYSSEKGRWLDTKKMMNYGFSQIVAKNPMEIYDLNPIILETSGYDTSDENLGRLTLKLRPESGNTQMTIVTTKSEIENLSKNISKNSVINYSRDFRAPIKEGEVFGTLTYISPQDNSSATFSLVASRDIERRKDAPLTLSQIENQVMLDPNFLPSLTLELFFYWIIPPIFIYFITSLVLKYIRKVKGKSEIKSIFKKKNRY